MHFANVKDDIYSVGVLNPNLRVFDIVMKTDYGTTYNSYIVKGNEKTALIETSHLKYFDYYYENIKMVCDPQKVDYLILNHCEPDHSGVIAKLLEVMPQLTVVTTKAGSIYIKNIANRSDLNLKVVSDGETIDLGGKTLQFVMAPFLHWPDTMFTYCPEAKTVFPCDFLGSHYCEPEIFDTRITYPDAYLTALKGYYDAIFGPFKPYVLQGLDKLSKLDFDTACTSHGPILTKAGMLDKVKELYLEWSTPSVRENKLIPIFYCSAYGNTRNAAKAIQSGIKEVLPDADVQTYDIIKHDMGELAGILNASDAFLIGSPTLNRDAVAPVWMLLAHIDAINIQKRPVALFGSYGWSGEACSNLRKRLEGLKVNLFENDCRFVFVPSEEDLEKAKQFGKDFASSLK